MNLLKLILFVSFALLSVSWDPVALGIDYMYHRNNGNNDVFILRIDRSIPNVIIDTMVAGERIKGSRERTTTLYARNDDALTSWLTGKLYGTRSKAVAAVNGYYFGMGKGTWISGGIANGWYIHHFTNKITKVARASGYSIKYDRKTFIGECVTHPDTKNYILIVKNGVKVPITGLNEESNGDLVIYTPQYDVKTPASSNGVDVVIEVSKPVGITNAKNKVEGKVIAVNKNKGSTIIPFDAIVVGAKGTKAGQLGSVAIGDVIEIYQDMNMYTETKCDKEIHNFDWQGTFSSLALDYHYLKGGKRQIVHDKTRHPRTAVAYNDRYYYFYVVDGRTKKSRGMTIDELGEFCAKYLNATDGGSLDGGGSSTIVVKGKIMNHPSDGSERTVTNGVLFAIPTTKSISKKHTLNEAIVSTTGTHLYSGPP